MEVHDEIVTDWQTLFDDCFSSPEKIELPVIESYQDKSIAARLQGRPATAEQALAALYTQVLSRSRTAGSRSVDQRERVCTLQRHRG